MKIIYTALLIFLIPIVTTAQSYVIPTSPTLTYLYNSTNEISNITHTENLKLFTPNINEWRAKFKLVKNKSGLYAFIDGTGHVYKATNLDQNNITFTRIDSTVFIGYNFKSIYFSFKETLYSFGGYGFWSRNGQLAHFIPGSEWMVDRINKTYKTMNQFYSYQPAESKIYYVDFPWKEETTFNKSENYNVIEFDIAKKQNKFLGKLNPKKYYNHEFLSIDIPSLNGIINTSEGDMYLCNFSSNKVYKLTNLKIKDALIGKAGVEIQTTFEDEGKVYYSFMNDPTLRSISISMSDFKEEPYTLYIPVRDWMAIWIILASIGLISLSTFIFIYLKRRGKQAQSYLIQKDEVYTADLNSNEFSSIESALINKLIEKSSNDSHLTVDELNSLLGIKKKTIEIQKRVRTEAINRINHKFNVNFNLETIFIERTRSVEDRRYFNYTINQENAKVYLKQI
jgi:hypothetical protein